MASKQVLAAPCRLWKAMTVASRAVGRRWSSGSFSVHPVVSSAVQSGDPVVALETTILTHGMPHPHNIETALAVEEEVRLAGAVPASVGVLDGVVYVGLTGTQLERLATSPVQKISQRDLAYCISAGVSGGTTVSGTMLCAHKAGIPVFVTGGIGGVHRGGESSLDISADLVTLGRTPVAVICAGIKSILDIGRTLEYLETQGVPVITLGQKKTFPAFFTPESEHEAPYNIRSAAEAAKVIKSNLDFGVKSGIVLAVPPPPSPLSDGTNCSGKEIEDAIQTALKEASERGIVGKEITPFLLRRVNELTGGATLRANVELIKNNAWVGSHVAVELARLRRTGRKGAPLSSKGVEKHSSRNSGKVVVVGASVLDFTAKMRNADILREGTNVGSVSISFGGVGRNIAECMARLGAAPLFISAVGKDQNGEMLCEHLAKCEISLAGLHRSEASPTACYNLVLDHRGEMYCGIGDMDITAQISVDWVQQFVEDIKEASYVCIDGNIPDETMEYVLELCSSLKVPVWFEPTCVFKACKPFLLNCHGHISMASPNLTELRTMHHCLTTHQLPPPVSKHLSELTLKEKLTECVQLVRPLLLHIPTIVVSLGGDGVLHCSATEGSAQQPKFLHYPAAADHLLPATVCSVSGAGDSFVGSVLAGLGSGLSSDLSVKAGLHAAFLSLQCTTAISSQLSPRLLEVEEIKNWAPWEALRYSEL